MSRQTIDEKVVEMRFDNRQFESGAQQSIATLDKLKQSLRLNESAKSFEQLEQAAGKCDLSTVSKSAETVRAKFSALEVVAMTALSNITNSAVNAGKRIISAFTVEPITTGFNEYELKMGSIQTIMASTGESLDKVNQKLDELNRYSDRTIYSFSDMTSNIGKFTNAGVRLDDAVAAIQGVSNVAAVSGANANEASRAMYNFAQALSAGYVKLIDWKSIELANMATVEFKNQLLASAVAAGTLTKTANGMYKTVKGTVLDATHMFNDSLQDQWMTTEVLTKTLKDYADETTDIGKKAFAAAQDVKTWSQLLDTLKESAQSGWAETWQLIVGDYEEAKTTLRSFSEFFSSIIDGASEARNSLLSGALMSGWGQLKNKVAATGVSVDTFRTVLRETASASVEGFDQMVEEAGSFDASLSKGWLTTDIFRRALEKTIRETTGLSDETKALTEEEMRNVGWTEEQMQALSELSGTSKESASEMDRLIQSMSRKSGRELIFDTILNAAKAVQQVFGTLKDAWNSVFPTVTAERLYNLIDALHRFSEKMLLSEGTAEKLKRSFQGVFAILNIGRKAFDVILQVLTPLSGGAGKFAEKILDVTASFGDWAVELDKTIEQSEIFQKIISRLSGFIQSTAATFKKITFIPKDIFGISGWEIFSSLLERVKVRMSGVADIAAYMKRGICDALNAIGSAISNIPLLEMFQKLYLGLKNVSASILQGIGKLFKGIVKSIGSANFNGIFDLLNAISFAGIVASIKKFLGDIEKPFGKVNGVLKNVSAVLNEVRGCFEAYQSQLKAGILLKIASAIAILTGSIVVLSLIDSGKLTISLAAITALFADLMASMVVFDKIGGKTKDLIKTSSLMISMSASIFILASALKKISDLNGEQLAVGITGIVGLLTSLVAAAKILGSGSKSAIKGAGQMVLLASSIKILASVAKDLSTLSTEEMGKGLLGIGTLLAELAVFTKLSGNTKHIMSSGTAMIAMAAAMKILASALAQFGQMSWNEIGRGLVTMAGALTAIAVAFNFLPKNTLSISVGLIAVGTALNIIASVLQKAGTMSWESIAKGLIVLGGALAELAVALHFMQGTLAGSAALLVAAASIAMLTPALMLLGQMSWSSIVKGLVAIAGAFTVLGVAGALLTPLVPVILGLSAAFALVGVGVIGIGAGIIAIAAGITSLSVALGAGVTVIVAGLTSIIIGIASLIPAIAEKIGEAIVAFCQVISGSASVIADCALDLITNVLASIVGHTAQITDYLMQFLIALIEGIAHRMPELVSAAIDLLVNFFAGITNALSNFDTDTLLKSLVGIGLLSGIMLALSAIAGLVPAAMIGILGMGAVIAELALVLAAVGAFAQIPGLHWLIGEGGKLLENIGVAIGGFIGGIAGGFIGGISGQLPRIAEELSSFMAALQPFLNGIGAIRPEISSGAKALAETLLLLTAGDLLHYLTSWLTGGASLSGFAEQLIPFGQAIHAFSNTLNGIDTNLVSKAAIAGKTLAEMAATLPNSGGVVGFFSGENDLDAFGRKLVPFGKAIKDFSFAVEGIKSNAVSEAAAAGKIMAEMAKNIPNTGGVVGFFAGENDVDNFGQRLVIFGEAIKAYSFTVEGLKSDAVQNSATVGKVLAEMSKTVPKCGDLIAFFAGNGNLSSFRENAASFGSSLAVCIQSLASVPTLNLSETIEQVQQLVNLSEIVSSLNGNAFARFSTSLEKLAKNGIAGFIQAFSDSNQRVSHAISDMVGYAVTAIQNARRSFVGLGENVAQGFVEGIRGKRGLATAAGRDLGLAALNAAKQALDSHSPSREFIHLGENIGEGLAIGINNNIVPTAQASSNMIGEVIRVSQKGIDAFENWLDEKKYYNEISLKDELAGWEQLQKKYAIGSEERKKIDREVYRVQNELVSATYQASLDWIEEEKYYGRLSKEEELAAYERMQSRYLWGSEERKKIDREVYRLRNELAKDSYQFSMNWIEKEKEYGRLSLEEEIAAYERVKARYAEGNEEWENAERNLFRLRNEQMQKSYQFSMDWIEEEKYYKRMSLADELAAYKRVQSRYKQGSEERKKMDREVYRLEKEIADAQKQYISDVQRIQEDATQKRLEAEEEYTGRVRSMEEQLADDIESENKRYTDALESRSNSLYRSYGLFDEIKEREEVSAETLMQNLQGQVKEFGEWQDILDNLSLRGVDSKLISELQEMGPSSIAQIKALETMSDSELTKYVDLWSIKHAQAREQAVGELEELRTETLENMEQLRTDAEEELAKYYEEWMTKLAKITNDADTELEQLRQDFGKTVGLIRTDTEAELQEMSETSQKILREAGWDKTGQNIVDGLTAGVRSSRLSLLEEITNLALSAVEAVQDTLDIHSPSRVFQKLGQFTGLGFVQGLHDYIGKTRDAGTELAETAEDGLAHSISDFADMIENGIDIQPTITPVFDLSNVTTGARELQNLLHSQYSEELAWKTSTGFYDGRTEHILSVQNDDVVQELRTLRGDMSEIARRMERLQIVLDSGTLVGELTGPIDITLGQRMTYRGRGN